MNCEANDIQWMAQALQLAERGRYTARPNPCVGCVIVALDEAGLEQELVGSGWHRRAGEAHAEVNALAMAGDKAQGATAYVTLEPCHHQGRTGPCTQALMDAGISRVVYGMQDPNPLVAGKGLAALVAAGIKVDGPVLEDQARALNPGFIAYMENKRPWLRCKLASSLDGRTAMADGDSQWITGPAARKDVQRWRARSSAIITGIDSVLRDNSRLTLRQAELELPEWADVKAVLALSPLRVVLDTHLRTPLDAAILQAGAPTLLVCGEQASLQTSSKVQSLEALPNVELLSLPLNDAGKLNLEALLAALVERACYDVLLEAGATLSGAFVEAGLVDELIVYQAPVFMGSEGRPLLSLPLAQMQDKLQLNIIDQRPVGCDQRIIAHIQRSR